MEIVDYLATWNHPAFVRGKTDCCAFVAGWVEFKTGRPLFNPWLGRPLTDREALRMVREGGGIRRMVREALRDHGWHARREGERFEDGDVIVGQLKQPLFPVTVGLWSCRRVLTVGRDGAVNVMNPEDFGGKEAWHGN